MHPVTFWLIYTIAGVWAQMVLPGVDFFAPAVVVCLQERRLRQLCWLLPLWIMIQEGAGNIPFGSMILWYAGLSAVFVIGRWLFESRNVVFVLIIGMVMGGWRFVLVQLMAGLQGLEVGEHALFVESVQQAVLFPLIWALAFNLYRSKVPDAGTV
ncbi:hypothetical protein [Desulfocurvus sp. DL9XJH121]